MQIISSRQFRFEKEEYTDIVDENGKCNGSKNRNVTEAIIVRAHQNPQVVPAWVGETDLFKTAVEDGTIVAVELAGATPTFAVNNESKAGFTGAQTPVAAFVDGTQQPAEQSKTQTGLAGNSQGGWGK